MSRGNFPYGRIIRLNTRRLYLNSFVNKIMLFLDEDFSNLYDATIKAIESYKPEQFSSKKRCKESAISLAKFLIYKSGGEING
jgi:hypothetical protein